MNLSSMRDINAADPVGGLGPRVTPAPTPAPQPVKRGDGFIVGPDGKLSTDLPDPTVPAVIGGVLAGPDAYAAASPKQEPAEDVPDGAMWQSTISGKFFKDTDGCLMIYTNSGTWTTSSRAPHLDRSDLTPVALPIAAPSEPRPLRVGDRVRLIGETIWQSEYLGRIGLVVTADEELVAISVDSGTHIHSHLELEGREWERVK